LLSSRFVINETFGNAEIPRKPDSQTSLTISTEFPSLANAAGEKNPGPLLLRLKEKEGADNNVADTAAAAAAEIVRISFDDLQGITHTVDCPLEFGADDEANRAPTKSGVRKAMLLVQYGELLSGKRT
jgi:hypothetical protein